MSLDVGTCGQRRNHKYAITMPRAVVAEMKTNAVKVFQTGNTFNPYKRNEAATAIPPYRQAAKATLRARRRAEGLSI
jgi:hypothetical protein